MEIVIKRLHAPWPNVRLPAGTRMKIEPDWVAEAVCARGFAEKIAQDILSQEKPPDEKKKTGKRGQ